MHVQVEQPRNQHARLRELGDGVRGRDLHGVGDAPGARVERAAEDARKAQRVVDRAPVDGQGRAGFQCQRRCDLGNRVREREDDLSRAHLLGLDQPGPARGRDDHLGAGHDAAQVDGVSAERLEARGGLGVDVAAHEIFDAVGGQQLRDSHPRGAETHESDAEPVELEFGLLHGVEQGGQADDGRTVLVVVHHGNRQLLDQPLLDLETLGRRHVLDLDRAERGRDLDHRLDEGVCVA